jgi:hypothetical protein
MECGKDILGASLSAHDPKQTWRHGLAIAHLIIDLAAGGDIT